MEQLEKDVEWLKANIKHLTEGQVELRDSMKALADTMKEMCTMKHDIDRIEDEVQLSRNRYHELSSAITAKPCELNKRDIARLTDRADKIELRVEDIENCLPTLRLSSNWVFKAFIAAVGMLGTISVGIIMHAINTGGL